MRNFQVITKEKGGKSIRPSKRITQKLWMVNYMPSSPYLEYRDSKSQELQVLEFFFKSYYIYTQK